MRKEFFSYGASLGGIRGVLFSQVEPRVKASAAFCLREVIFLKC